MIGTDTQGPTSKNSHGSASLTRAIVRRYLFGETVP